MIEREVTPQISRHDRWAAKRCRGRRSFIIRYGILTCGLLFATLRLLDDYFGFLGAPRWKGLWPELASFIFAALFFGTAMGWFFWWWGERRFGAKSSRDGTPPV